MGFLILLLLIPVLALAAQRNDFRRLMFISVFLEAVKFFFLLVAFPRSEFTSFLLVVIFYVGALPEMLIGGEVGPGSLGMWILVLGAGIVWNTIPAYFISLLLPERQTEIVDTSA
jgi:hypothetical protein